MEALKDIVNRVIDQLQHHASPETQTLMDAWPACVGTTIAQHTKPYRYTNHKLYVKVDDATWAYELSQKYKQELLHRLNARQGGENVHDIVFSIGSIV